MRFQQDLQVMVRDRQRRLLLEHFENGAHQIRLFVNWMEAQPLLMSLIEEAAEREPELDLPILSASILSSDSLYWPSRTEESQAALVWTVMKRIAADSAEKPEDSSFYTLGRGRRIQDGWREFVERIISPLFDYLLERLTQYSSVLHTLERYVHIVEWFTRTDLYATYVTRTTTGEEVYNDDLQQFLYQDGSFATHAKV